MVKNVEDLYDELEKFSFNVLRCINCDWVIFSKCIILLVIFICFVINIKRVIVIFGCNVVNYYFIEFSIIIYSMYFLYDCFGCYVFSYVNNEYGLFKYGCVVIYIWYCYVNDDWYWDFLWLFMVSGFVC